MNERLLERVAFLFWGGVGNVRKAINFILRYYNSLLLILVSLWLGALLISADHSFMGGLFIFLSLLKLAGMIIDNVKMRVIGLICLNAMWAANIVIFLTGQHPKGLPYQFPLVVLLVGLGVGIRGRFDE